MNHPAPSASAFAPHVRLLVCAGLLWLASAAAFGQASGSDYTASLPSVQRVETEIKGTDPTDTAARQVAVFEYLQVYIERIKSTRDYRGPYSPGEQKLRTDYAKAQYDLTQSFTKTHTPAEVSAFQQKEGQYSINNALDWIKQLEGQQAADTYRGAEQSLTDSYNRVQQQTQQQLNQFNGGGSQSGGGGLLGGLLGGGGGGGQLDAKQKRCLELGGSYNECAGALMGLVGAIGSLVTLGASTTPEGPPPLNGVILVGMYHSRTDLPEIALTWNGAATLRNCGTLVDGTHPYTFRKSGGTTQIVVDNEPDPIVLTLRGDGSLAGPGSIQVKGSIIIGYHEVTTTRGGNCQPNCVSTTSTPIYQPSMQRCTISLLAPQAAPPPPPKQTGLIGDMADMMGANTPVATIYGFRVTGDYTSSTNMQLSFNNGFVTLDCGQAHINAPYTVDNSPTGFVVHIQNAGGAFLLAAAPDDTLRGSGSTTVNGRLVSAVNGQNVSFTPHSETCNVGTFAPKGQRNTMLASNGPMPAIPAAYSSPAPVATAPAPAPASDAAEPSSVAAAPAPIEASLASAGISSAPSGARSQLRVLLSSNFSGTNPLAGQAVFVSRKPMDQILRELGVPVPANANPAQAMKILQTLCHSPQGCSTVMQKLPSYYVTTAKLDTAGKATLNATAATGSYYFFAIVPSNGGTVLWDVPANLAAGDNTVTFTQANSQRVQ